MSATNRLTSTDYQRIEQAIQYLENVSIWNFGFYLGFYIQVRYNSHPYMLNMLKMVRFVLKKGQSGGVSQCLVIK